MHPFPSGQANNRIVITGGPGSGKTTIVLALQSLGYTGFPEMARELIGNGISSPDWSNKRVPGRFFDLILSKRILQHQEIKGSEIGFYDRGIPDSLAYFRCHDRRIPERLSEAVKNYRYHPVVFATPPWEEIFRNDRVRRESFSESCQLYEMGTGEYQRSGYEILELPRVSVEARIKVIVRHLNGYTESIGQQNDK